MPTSLSNGSFEDQTHFGYATVPLAEKQALVDGVFNRVAPRYDLMNDLMSAGLHRLWKDALVAQMPLTRRGILRHLDVAGGTGDIAFRMARSSRGKSRSTVLDINPDMLDVGRSRATKAGLSDRVDFLEGNAEALPFESNVYDVYSIAFGIRNLPRMEIALTEAYRVLRRGGRFFCLEFSHVDVPGLAKLYDLYSFRLIPALGRAVTGDAAAYQYLVESIRKFPGPERFCSLIETAGFRRVVAMPMTGGVVAIHSGWKL